MSHKGPSLPSDFRSEMPDEASLVEVQLAEAHRAGGDTLGLLYRRFVFRIYRYCLTLGLSEADAEDASHEVVLRADKALAQFRFGEPMWPWLASITRNYCRDLQRRERRMVSVSEFPEAADEDGLDEEIHRRGSMRLVLRALDNLPSTDARVIYLKDFQNRHYDEIAADLNLSIPAVRSKLFRARRGLRTEIERVRREDPSLPCLLGGLWLHFRTWARRASSRPPGELVPTFIGLLGVAGITAAVLTGPPTYGTVTNRPPQITSLVMERPQESTQGTSDTPGVPLRSSTPSREAETRRFTTPSVGTSTAVKDPANESEVQVSVGPANVRCRGFNGQSEDVAAWCASLVVMTPRF